jgi:hypothetical protein
MAVPPQLVNPLIDAIAASDVDELITLLASLFRPPTLRNTSGEELVFHTITWAVAEPESIGAALTAAGLDGDDDEWRLTEDTPGMRDAIMTTVRFDASDGVLVAETNSDERAAHITEVIADALPSARLLHDERRTFDDVRADRLDDEYLDDDDASGGLDPDDPEIRRMLDEFVKAKEIEWVDEQIPALGGRTPREAVADPIGREEVIQLLASLPEPPPGEVGAFSAARLRAHLGLDD